MKTFEKGLSNKGYAKHTPTLRKPKFRLTDTHGFRIRENPLNSIAAPRRVRARKPEQSLTIYVFNHYLLNTDTYEEYLDLLEVLVKAGFRMSDEVYLEAIRMGRGKDR